MLFIPFLLSGCWSAKEIHNLAIVNAMGIDINDAGEYELTTVIVKPSALFSKSIGGTVERKQSQCLVETATGQTVLDAMSKLSKSVPGSMYVGHMDVVVFGEKAAREKLLPALDFISRADEFRPNNLLLVAKGKAADIVTASPELSKTIGLEVKNLTKLNRFVAAKMVKDISKFREALTSNTSDPVTAVLTSSDSLGIQTKVDDQGSSHNFQKEKPKLVSLDGTAVFKKGYLKGFLNEKETRGLLWIMEI
jgi:spore germination protein KC